MSEPIVLSDEDELSTPFHPTRSKKRRTEPDPTTTIPTVLVLDDDPTPQKPALDSTPSFVPETPMSDVAILKCTMAQNSNLEEKFSGINGLICLESDNESEGGGGKKNWKDSEAICSDFVSGKDSDQSFTFNESTCSLRHAAITQMSEDDSRPSSSQNEIPQVRESPGESDWVHERSGGEYISMDQLECSEEERRRSRAKTKKTNSTKEAMGRKKMTKDERDRLMEEKKLKKLQEKLQKAALKAEAAELKKVEKEKKKWESGKFAIKSIVAEIDAKVVELGSIGGTLLTRFAEKGFTYRITSNPIERSIIWTMDFPEHIAQLSHEGVEIQYVMLVYESEEFCNLVNNESLLDHVYGVRNRYPSHTVCYLTNRLMSFINKREQERYKHPKNNNGWRRPPVEEVLAKLTTHFVKVHSRQCVDEAEVAEHIVGLTCSLASCQYRKKLTRLSVNANGSIVPKDSIDRNLIKKSLWLKTLVAIPKVQPRFAIAIWKKYPTMKSLLSVYMDPSKSMHEKEFLLKDLTTEGLLGEDRRLGEVCSKRVYRILMAQSGCIKTDEIEEGADFFRC